MPQISRIGRSAWPTSASTNAAVTKFRQALGLDSTLLIDPELDAGRDAALALVSQGETLEEAGDVAGATAKFREAVRIDPALVSNPDDRPTHVRPNPRFGFFDES